TGSGKHTAGCGTSAARSAGRSRACCSITRERWTGCPAPRHYRHMPKKIAKKDLPSPDPVETAKPLVETIEKRRTRLVAARGAAPKDGTLGTPGPNAGT